MDYRSMEQGEDYRITDYPPSEPEILDPSQKSEILWEIRNPEIRARNPKSCGKSDDRRKENYPVSEETEIYFLAIRTILLYSSNKKTDGRKPSLTGNRGNQPTTEGQGRNQCCIESFTYARSRKRFLPQETPTASGEAHVRAEEQRVPEDLFRLPPPFGPP